MGYSIPAFPSPTAAPARHWALNAVAFAARVLAWLVVAAVLGLVLMVVFAVAAFLPFLRGAGGGHHRRW